MRESTKLSRRGFIEKTAVSGAVGSVAPYFVSASALGLDGEPGANDRLGIGLIGAGLMGTANLNNCAKYEDVAVTGVCDVWRSKRERLVEKFKGLDVGQGDLEVRRGKGLGD